MPLSQETLRSLYVDQRKSMSEIAILLKCSIHKVVYWMTRYHIPRRNHSDANYLKYNPNGNPFKIKTNLSYSERNLRHLGFGLFWGEGNKVSKTDIRLGNSDPSMLQIWRQFLLIICQINPDKIHYHLQVFKDNNLSKARKYWAIHLNISPHHISSGQPTKPLGKGSYRKISSHGVMTIGVYNIKLRAWLFDELKKIGYNPDSKYH